MGFDARLLNLTVFKTIPLAIAAFPRPRRPETLDATSMGGQFSYPAEADPIPGMQAGHCALSIPPALDTENEIVELATGGSASIATETLIVRADGARRGLTMAAIRSTHQGTASSTHLNVGMTAALTDIENGARRDSLPPEQRQRPSIITAHYGLGFFSEGGSDLSISEAAIEANFSTEARRAGVSLAFADEGHEESLARRPRGNIWAITLFAHPRGECGHSRPSMN